MSSLSLLLLFIILIVISALIDNKKKQSELPPLEQETSTYRFPQDIREKWGPGPEEIEYVESSEEIREPQWVEPVITAPKADPPEASPKALPLVEKAVSNKPLSPDSAQIEEENLLGGHLTPAMLKNGIILSEILGPPVARRRGRSYQ